MSPFALIMGELRASSADLMWVKTERYFHRGINFQAAPQRRRAGRQRSGRSPQIPAAGHEAAGKSRRRRA